VYDLQADTLRQLTDDSYADVQPAWSPDGSSIAFVTDRFGTDLNTLRMGAYGLALIDTRTGAIRPLFSFPDAKAINPQWSPDGRSVYFLSDRNGTSNVYRLELASTALYQITDLYTGVSGITALSPALSVAAGSGRLAFSAYERGAYNVYRIDDPDRLAGRRLTEGGTDLRRAALPPGQRERPLVTAMLENPIFGLPSGQEFTTRPYRPRLSLDYVSDPYLTFGSDRFGTYFGGGASLYWSDMLGTHNVVTMLQVQGGLRDIAALAGYQNLAKRLNWGFAAQQIPYVTGSYDYGYDLAGNLIEQTVLYRQINRDVTAFAAYPFNRVRRMEFSAGYRNVTFHGEVETVITDLSGNSTRDRLELPTQPGLHLASASAALVYDNALFGWTGPILGQRYRLEAAPMVGSINFVNALADYRRYVMPVRPFTLAGRLMHYGRWGSGGDDTRLAPLFLGYPGIVRGYDLNSFSVFECDVAAAPACPVFDRLVGSRILVGNAELRFPPLGALGIGPGLFGILPIDLVGFFDAGVAWTGDEKPSFLSGGTRDIVTSAGVGLRANLLGFAIIELDYVKPFHRPVKGAHWQFGFTQAF
jgi:hypothetical protein